MLSVRVVKHSESDQVVNIVKSRDHLMTERPMDHKNLESLYTSEGHYDRTKHDREIIGVFDGKVLDAFWALKYIDDDLSPTAYDQTKREKSVFINAIYSMNRPKRLKNKDGFDVNSIELYRWAYQYFTDSGYFTNWVFVPHPVFRSWEGDSETMKAFRYQWTSFNIVIPAGEQCVGPNFLFVNRHLCQRPFTVAMCARVNSKLPEYR